MEYLIHLDEGLLNIDNFQQPHTINNTSLMLDEIPTDT